MGSRIILPALRSEDYLYRVTFLHVYPTTPNPDTARPDETTRAISGFANLRTDRSVRRARSPYLTDLTTRQFPSDTLDIVKRLTRYREQASAIIMTSEREMHHQRVTSETLYNTSKLDRSPLCDILHLLTVVILITTYSPDEHKLSKPSPCDVRRSTASASCCSWAERRSSSEPSWCNDSRTWNTRPEYYLSSM